MAFGGKLFCYGYVLNPPKRLGLLCLRHMHMRTGTAHSMPHYGAAMRALQGESDPGILFFNLGIVVSGFYAVSAGQ